MPTECPLAEANASRKRAWREMQSLRAILALVVELPPVGKPASFEAEGAALRAGLARALLEFTSKLDALEKAVAGIRPFISNAKDEAGYPHALMALNRASNQTKVSTETLRTLSDAGRADSRRRIE